MADEDRLCSFCCKLDFRRLFFACGTLTEANNTRSLEAIRKANNCPFCRLTLRMLNSNPEVQRPKNASCIMRTYEFGALIRPRSTAISPTMKSWTLSELEGFSKGPKSRKLHPRYRIVESFKRKLPKTNIKSSPKIIPLGPTISRLSITLRADLEQQGEVKHETEPNETRIPVGVQVSAVESVTDNPEMALLRGRSVNPTADVDLLRGWLEICKSSHGRTCCPLGMPGTRNFCF